MSDLPNELAWSVSRAKTFGSCARRYYYQHYLKWNGWNSDAPEERRRCYALSKMTTLPMFIGSKVHEEIGWLLDSLRHHRSIRIREDRIRSAMRFAFAASESSAWEQNPSKVFPFHEDVYGNGLSGQERQSAIDTVLNCVTAFYESSIFRGIEKRNGSLTWHRVDGDGFDAFDLNGYKVHAYPDFAAGVGGKIHLFDWKLSGNGDHALQMSAYALWAQVKLDVTADAMVVNIVSLQPAVNQKRVVFSQEELDATARLILDSCKRMEALHQDGLGGNKDALPPTDKLFVCTDCAFLEICDGRCS